MRRQAGQAGPILALALVLAVSAAAQSPLTENTLQLDEGATPPPTTIADVAPLIGHWRGAFLGGVGEETWLPPVGGAMVGTFRLIRDDAVVFYELMTLVEEEGGVVMHIKHFEPDLSGWEEKDETVPTRLIRAEPDALYFEGMTFRFPADGLLKGFLAMGSHEGEMTETTMEYRRVDEAGP